MRMYVEWKKIGRKRYAYLRISARLGKTIKTKTLCYLGKGTMTKKEIQDKIEKLPKGFIESARRRLQEEIAQNSALQFFTEEQLNTIQNIKKDFAKKLSLPDKKLLDDMFKDFKTYYIYNTNAIEGNTLTLEETDLILNQGKTPEGKDLREIYDHINEKEMFDYILQERPEITTETIIKIHAMLLKNIDKRTGAFRLHNVRVFGADFEPSDTQYVPTDMKLLFHWYQTYKRKLHPLILAAIFHEKFERIHPFYDGNGRTGRMLLNLLLLRNKLPPLIIKNKERKEYYRVLSLGHNADLTKADPKYYKDIVQFCYAAWIETYKNIFSKWG